MGMFEQAKGKAKEVVGSATRNPGLEREGAAQRRKGEAQTAGSRAQAEAEAHAARAREKEVEQEIAQHTK
jgi:uncharacterized protein YjbJ (UPF0337 family)